MADVNLTSGNVKLIFYSGKTATPISVGQVNSFKAKPGERYRVVKETQEGEQLLDNLLVKHIDNSLKLEYSDGTQVVLENYFIECKPSFWAIASRAGVECDVTVAGGLGGSYQITAHSAGGASLGDGSTLIYAHGSYDAMKVLAQDNAVLQKIFSGYKISEITYVPAAFEVGNTQLLVLGGGVGVLAAAGGGGGLIHSEQL